MKCVKSVDGKISRVSDVLAAERVESGKFQYCGKAEWKKTVRDVGKNKTSKKDSTTTDPESV